MFKLKQMFRTCSYYSIWQCTTVDNCGWEKTGHYIADDYGTLIQVRVLDAIVFKNQHH